MSQTILLEVATVFKLSLLCNTSYLEARFPEFIYDIYTLKIWMEVIKETLIPCTIKS